MAAEATGILSAVRTALAGVTGLSSERVRRGTWQSTDALAGGGPVVWVAASTLASEYGPDLCGYKRTLMINCVLSAEAAGADFGSREDAVLDLLDLCVGAVEAMGINLSLKLTQAPRVVASGLLPVEGVAAPMAAFTVEVVYTLMSGEGV